MDRLRRVAQLVAAPDANRRAAVSRALYFFASPVRAGELQTLGGWNGGWRTLMKGRQKGRPTKWVSANVTEAIAIGKPGVTQG